MPLKKVKTEGLPRAKSSQVILTTKKNAVTKARVLHRYIFCHIAFFYGIVNNRETHRELEKNKKSELTC
jgi:hypothetical protein